MYMKYKHVFLLYFLVILMARYFFIGGLENNCYCCNFFLKDDVIVAFLGSEVNLYSQAIGWLTLFLT